MLKLKCTGLFLTWALLNSANAIELPSPKDPIILTVEGNVSIANRGDHAAFDLSMLKALGAITVDTNTPWTDGVIRFKAVPLLKVLAATGASGTSVIAHALNDYKSIVPMSVLDKGHAYLAFKMNETLMTRRDKGPLWLIFPWSDHPEYLTPQMKIHAVWQLNKLRVQ